MTALQAARVNARVGERKDVLDLLAPSQVALLERIEAAPQAGWDHAIGVEFRRAWVRAAKRASALD